LMINLLYISFSKSHYVVNYYDIIYSDDDRYVGIVLEYLNGGVYLFLYLWLFLSLGFKNILW
jgi:hypothetical protein